MKKYLNLFIGLLVFLVAMVMPTMVNAATNGLPDAVENVITLTEDVTLTGATTLSGDTICVEEGSTVTLDLAGNSLELNTTIEVYGSLTIKDSVGGGTLTTTATVTSIEVEGGTFTLESGTITNSKTYAVYCLEGGTAIVEGGTIESKYAPLSGNNTTGVMHFEVNGGTLTATYGPAIYMPGQVSLDITGGTLNGGISLRMGTVNISGGTINAITTGIDKLTDWFSDKLCYGYAYSGNIWFADALYVIGGTYTFEGGNELDLTITGGTFNAANGSGSAVAVYDLGKVEQTMSVSITGGTFNSDAGEAYKVTKFSEIGMTDADYGVYEGSVLTTITGGTYSTDVDTAYVASNYVVNESEGSYVVEKQEVTVDTTEVDTSATVEEITAGVSATEDYASIISEALEASNIDTDNKNVTVSVEVETVAEDSIDSNVVDSIEATASEISSDVVIAGYLDITLNVVDTDTDETLGTIDSTKTALIFTVVLPSDLQTVEEGYTRTFYVIRYHDGVAEKLEATLSADSTYITFESDKFSTYALAYVDVEVASTSGTTDNTTNNTTDDTSDNTTNNTTDGTDTEEDTTTSEIPQTGDIIIGAWVVAIIVGLVGLGLTYKKSYVSKH